MDFNYTLKYQTFDQLLESVKVDLRSLSLEGKIDPQTLIKVALRVNYDLGLRINMIKEQVLEIHRGKARLPDDFRVMNYALICGEFTETRIMPQGTHVEDVAVIPVYQDPVEPSTCSDPVIDPCTPTLMPNTTTPLCLTKCGAGFQLVQKINTQTRTYSTMMPIRFRNSKHVDCACPNLHWMCNDEAYIKDNFIWFSNALNSHQKHIDVHANQHQHFDHGKLFINYEGALEDDDGNMLVPDHPMLNEYYEYALKQRILENLLMDGDSAIVANLYKLVEERLRGARNNALTIVNTPNFSEMQHVWAMNRKAQYSKYYDMFKSYGNFGGNLKVGNQV